MKRETIYRALALVFFFLGVDCSAQIMNPEYVWGKGITAGNTGSAYHVAMDKSGVNGIVQVGRYTDTLYSGSNTLLGGGMYINYSDTNGVVLWIKKEGLNYGPNIFGYSCPSPLDVEMLPNGDVVVLGTLCADSANVINGWSMATNGYFIAKYNSSGVFQWIKTYNVKSTTYRTGTIEASHYDGVPNNFIYAAFTYGDTVEMVTDTLIGHSNNANTVIFALDLAGNELWAHNIPGEQVIPKDIRSFYNTHLYLLFDYEGIAPSGLGQPGSAIRKFDLTNGLMKWETKIGEEYNGNLRKIEADAFDVSTPMSRLVVVGRFSGDMILGPDTLHTANGGTELDIWITEIDTSDLDGGATTNGFEWARSITSPGQDYAVDVISYGYDAILAGSLGLGGGVVGGNTLGAGSFLASYNANGNVNWALQQPSGFQEYIHDIKPHYSFGPDGVFIGGGIAFEALFGNDTIENAALFTNTVSQVSYLAKIQHRFTCNLQAQIAGNDTLIACQANQQLVATAFGGTGHYSYSWSPAQYLNNPNLISPSVVEYVHLQQFVFTATDNNTGCTATDSVVVGVYKPHAETIYLCPGDTAYLDLGPGASIYDWVNLPFAGPTAQVAWVDTPGTFWGVATYPVSFGCGSLTSSFVVIDSCTTVSHDSVWPGDANSDGMADLYDVLNIGIGYNVSGPVRANASTVWVAQPAADWNLAFLNGINLKHADCDGDGHIDSLDVDVVSLNYGLTHLKTQGSQRRPGSPPISVSYIVDTAYAPDFVTANIDLGDPSLPITDGYGVAFSLLFDTTLVDSSSIQTDFTGSWLGNGDNPQSLTKNLFGQGQLDIAYTRTTHTPISGYGHIGTVSFYIQDNIIGKDYAAYFFGLEVAGSLLISDDETVIELDEVSDSVLVRDEYVGIAEVAPAEVSIYPNPSNGLLFVSVQAKDVAELSVINVLGEVVYTTTINSHPVVVPIDLTGQANGVYLIKVQNGGGTIVKRIAKQ